VKRVVFFVRERAVWVEVVEIVSTGRSGDNNVGRWGWLGTCDVGCVALEEDVMIVSHLAYREEIVFRAWHDDSMRDADRWVIGYWDGRGALVCMGIRSPEAVSVVVCLRGIWGCGHLMWVGVAPESRR